MASPDALGLCTVCNKSNARLCSRCKSARFCSTVCQHADWPTHKLLCATFSNFDALSRPTDEHLRAILFPVDEKKPKIIWLHCRYQCPDYEPLLGSDTLLNDITIQYNPVLKRKLSNTIYVSHRDTFLGDGSKPNKSIAAITDTKPGQYYDWRGPIIAYGMQGLGIDQIYCRDLDMNDFRHITDYFLWYHYIPGPATQQSVKGVKINCIGDQKMSNKPNFEAVEIPLTDPIFSTHDTSDIAKRIGLPIFTRRCLPDPKWANHQDSKIFEHQIPFNNQDATFLHLCCDPKADFNLHMGTLGWGWASQQWQNSVGSVIVVREDKKPLFPLHVEALCKYCRYEIRPLLGHCNGEYAPEEPMEKNAVLPMICRPTFIIYWYKLLAEKHKEGEDTSVPSPYDM
ncbi:zinc finger mynd-type protein [Elaphomyces granulatus]